MREPTCTPFPAHSGPTMHTPLATPPNPSPRALVSPQKLVSIDKLLPPGFMKRHSRFRDVHHMLVASGVNSDQILEADPDGRHSWNTFIRVSTDFPDWAAMLREARGEWLMRRIGIFIDA